MNLKKTKQHVKKAYGFFLIFNLILIATPTRQGLSRHYPYKE